MKIRNKVEVGAIVQYLYMHVHMYPGNTQILIYVDGEHSTLTIENVLSASHSCRFQMAASIKTNKIDLREFVLYSTGLLKEKHSLIKNSFYSSPTMLIVICTSLEFSQQWTLYLCVNL